MINVINITDYKKGKRISKSGFGALYHAEEKKTGDNYDAKIIDCDDDEEKLSKMMTQKVEDIMSFKHQTIINIIGYSKLDFAEENNIVVIMDHAKNGSLADLIQRFQEKNEPSQYSNTNRQMIIAGIARGMKLLHDRNITHLDLKSSNILLDENYKPIITDFYLTNLIEIKKSLDQFSGNLPYLAPEILNGTSHDKKSDIYAFGILMYEIITSSFAYPELRNGSLSDLQFQNKVISENYRPTFTERINESLQQLIEKCLSSDPKERPDFEEIFNKIAFCNNDDTNSKSNKYFLDDVDVEKYTQYINEIADPQEQLLSKMLIIEEENKQLKNDIIHLKKEKEEYLTKIEKEKELLKKEINDMKNQNEENLKKIALLEKDSQLANTGNACLKDRNQVYVKQLTDLKEEIRILKRSNTFLKDEDQEHIKILTSYAEKNRLLRINNNKIISDFELFINEITISAFNMYNLELQQKLMEKLYNSSQIIFTDKCREFFRKINVILVYLKEFDNIKKSCIKLIGNDEKIIIKIEDEIPIQLNMHATDVLFQSKYFSLSNFTLYAKMFNEFRLELGYPQSSFDDIYSNAIKTKNTNSSKCMISIMYSGGKGNDICTYFRCNKNISYLTIDKSVTEIRSEDLNGSFENCSSLVQVILPDSITSIGKYSFAGCSSLTEISLPSKLEKMDNYCFKNCQQLEKISIPFALHDIPFGCFEGCIKLENVSIHSYVTTISQKAFQKCHSLTEITLPSSILIIGSSAFNECRKLKKIKIPSSVKEIPSTLFYECSSLTEVSISSSAKTIGNYAFKGCSSLEHITIPSSVASIEEGAFDDCSSLNDISFENPSSLTEIDKFAFRNCKSLKKIIFPSSLTQIGEKALETCTSLTEVSISSSAKTIGNYAFKGCSSLEHITIPSSVASIKEGAFDDCSSLNDISFENPSSLTEIDKFAFRNCKSLKKISLPSSLTQMGANVFNGCTSFKLILILSDINTNEIGLQPNVKIVNNPDDFVLDEPGFSQNPFCRFKFNT